MRISARNQFKGKILEVKKGATTAHIRLEIAPGQVITASITNEAVEELGLKAGATAVACAGATSTLVSATNQFTLQPGRAAWRRKCLARQARCRSTSMPITCRRSSSPPSGRAAPRSDPGE